MAVLNATQTGTVTIAAGSASQTATITAVVLANSILTFGASFNDASPQFGQVSGKITNTTTLTFERTTAASSPAITIRWYVAEFNSGVSVQRGAAAFAATDVTVNVTISAVTLNRSFAIISVRVAGASYTDDDFFKARLTTTTNLEITRSIDGLGSTVEWQVIEFTDSVVQTGEVSFLSTDASKTATITSVNTTKTWLLFSYTSSGGTNPNIGQKMLLGEITNGTTLTFTRDNTGSALAITYFVVEFTDSTTVQKGTRNFTTAETTVDTTISAITIARSVVSAGAIYCRGGKTPYSADDNPGVGTVTMELTTTTNLQMVRGVTGSQTLDVGWFVIEFASAGVGLSIPVAMEYYRSRRV